MAFLERNVEKGTSPLCGNSVWKDRQFLERYMPDVMAFLHYRIIDVSTVKELVRRWYPPPFHPPKKREVHRALDDIRESIAELTWYRQRVFVPLGTLGGAGPPQTPRARLGGPRPPNPPGLSQARVRAPIPSEAQAESPSYMASISRA